MKTLNAITNAMGATIASTTAASASATTAVRHERDDPLDERPQPEDRAHPERRFTEQHPVTDGRQHAPVEVDGHGR